MRKITIPAFRKDKRVIHGPIEIMFDERQFTVVEAKWLEKHPAYAIQRLNGGPVVATIPTQDPDSIWQPGDEEFNTSNRSGGIVNSLVKESWWKRSPLTIRFCSPIPCF